MATTETPAILIVIRQNATNEIWEAARSLINSSLSGAIFASKLHGSINTSIVGFDTNSLPTNFPAAIQDAYSIATNADWKSDDLLVHIQLTNMAEPNPGFSSIEWRKNRLRTFESSMRASPTFFSKTDDYSAVHPTSRFILGVPIPIQQSRAQHRVCFRCGDPCCQNDFDCLRLLCELASIVQSAHTSPTWPPFDGIPFDRGINKLAYFIGQPGTVFLLAIPNSIKDARKLAKTCLYCGLFHAWLEEECKAGRTWSRLDWESSMVNRSPTSLFERISY
jgi:hypothetical protein